MLFRIFKMIATMQLLSRSFSYAQKFVFGGAPDPDGGTLQRFPRPSIAGLTWFSHSFRSLECIKFVFDRGPYKHDAGSLHRSQLDPLVGLKWPTSKGEGQRRNRRGAILSNSACCLGMSPSTCTQAGWLMRSRHHVVISTFGYWLVLNFDPSTVKLNMLFRIYKWLPPCGFLTALDRVQQIRFRPAAVLCPGRQWLTGSFGVFTSYHSATWAMAPFELWKIFAWKRMQRFSGK